MKTILLIILLAFFTATLARKASGKTKGKEVKLPQFSQEVMSKGSQTSDFSRHPERSEGSKPSSEFSS